MPRSLPARPNLDHLKKQAKELLNDLREGNQEALKLMSSGRSRPLPARAKLADAQNALAREYGFANWTKLKTHVETLTQPPDAFEEAAAAYRADDPAALRRILARHRQLRARINEPIPGGAFGATPLICAVQRANREMIDVLLEAGADINARSRWWAGGFGVLDHDHGLTSFLIERGAIVDAHAAARLGMLDRLEELVASDPQIVHARGGDGQTPLHFARTIEIARFLLDSGADIDARDIDHESTPAQYMLRDRQDVARYLISRGCRTDILMASAVGDLELSNK